MASRPATADDIDLATRIVTLAFADDPIWGLALRRSDGSSVDLVPYWRLFVEGGRRFGTTRVAEDGAAVAVWLPPGEAELSGDQLDSLETFLARALDPAALDDLHDLFERFEASRAGQAPHYYLSLLATNPAFRGQGRGQILLAESLALWDAEGVPAYLESTNSANDHRYERAGFRTVGGFHAVRDDTRVSAMWRPDGG